MKRSDQTTTAPYRFAHAILLLPRVVLFVEALCRERDSQPLHVQTKSCLGGRHSTSALARGDVLANGAKEERFLTCALKRAVARFEEGVEGFGIRRRVGGAQCGALLY